MRRVRRGYPKTYNSRRPLKIILTVLISLIAVVVILTVSLFFGLRKYIVYDPDGTLHLEIPWLEEDMPPD
jgi:hypothetical protein